MTFDHHHLAQADIDRLSPEDYSMFLAYGDTFRYSPPEPTGEGSNQFWEAEATRLIEAAEREDILLGKRVRRSFNQRSATWSYPGDSQDTTKDTER